MKELRLFVELVDVQNFNMWEDGGREAILDALSAKLYNVAFFTYDGLKMNLALL